MQVCAQNEVVVERDAARPSHLHVKRQEVAGQLKWKGPGAREVCLAGWLSLPRLEEWRVRRLRYKPFRHRRPRRRRRLRRREALGHVPVQSRRV